MPTTYYVASGNAVFGDTSTVVAPRWSYVASGNIIVSNDASVRSSQWTYTAITGGSFGKSRLLFGNISVNVVKIASEWTYTAITGGSFGKSRLLFDDISAGVVSNRWSYTAITGGSFGKSRLLFGNISAGVKAFYPSYTPITVGSFGNSRLRFISATAATAINLPITPTGNAVFGDIAGVIVRYKNNVLGGKAVFGNSADAVSNAWSHVASGNTVFGGTADVVIYRGNYIPTGNAVFRGTAGFAATPWSYDTSGNAVFGGTGESSNNAWAYTASGNVVFGGSVNEFQLVGYTASGNAVFGGSASCKLILPFVASGKMILSGEVEATCEFDTYVDLTWNISVGILRYYRIEGKPTPYDLGGSSCGEGQCIRSFINISATSVEEVCEKLRELNWSLPIKTIQVFSTPVLKSDQTSDMDLSRNTLTDVTINVPDCLGLFTDLVAISHMGATAFVNVITVFSVVGGSSVVGIGGESGIVSSSWSYSASGNVVFGSSSSVSSPQFFIYDAEGSAEFSGTSTFYENMYLGTFVSSAGSTASLISTNYLYGFQSTNLLQPITTNVDSFCCGGLPPLLYLNHDFRKFAKLDKFLFINDLTINNNLRLVYSKRNNAWINNLYFKGISSTNDTETWNIISEFGCNDNSNGLITTGRLWSFSVNVFNKNLRTGLDKYTSLVLLFNPDIVCTVDQSIDSLFTLNVITKQSVPEVVQSVVLHDEIGLMKGVNFIKNNPFVKFRITSFTTSASTGNIDNSESVMEILA